MENKKLNLHSFEINKAFLEIGSANNKKYNEVMRTYAATSDKKLRKSWFEWLKSFFQSMPEPPTVNDFKNTFKEVGKLWEKKHFIKKYLCLMIIGISIMQK